MSNEERLDLLENSVAALQVMHKFFEIQAKAMDDFK